MYNFKHFSLLLSLVVLCSSFSSAISATPEQNNIDSTTSSLSSSLFFWGSKPRRGPRGSRGIIPLSPGVIDTYFVWSDRPLFLWYIEDEKEIPQDPIVQIIVRDEETNKIVWTQSVKLLDQKIFYGAEKPLEQGKLYKWELLRQDKSNFIAPSTFEIIAGREHDKIQSGLDALEQKLKVNKASQEKIAEEKANFFVHYKVIHKIEAESFNLWSDSLESIYRIAQPSPAFVEKRQAMIKKLCN